MKLLMGLIVAIMALTACSSTSGQGGGQNPRDVKVELLTDAAQVRAGQETLLQVGIEGLVDEDNTEVQFEIRQADNKGLPDLIEEVDRAGDGQYSARYTFKEPAKYDVYIHLYNADIHITKKKALEVKE